MTNHIISIIHEFTKVGSMPLNLEAVLQRNGWTGDHFRDELNRERLFRDVPAARDRRARRNYKTFYQIYQNRQGCVDMEEVRKSPPGLAGWAMINPTTDGNAHGIAECLLNGEWKMCNVIGTAGHLYNIVTIKDANAPSWTLPPYPACCVRDCTGSPTALGGGPFTG